MKVFIHLFWSVLNTIHTLYRTAGVFKSTHINITNPNPTQQNFSKCIVLIICIKISLHHLYQIYCLVKLLNFFVFFLNPGTTEQISHSFWGGLFESDFSFFVHKELSLILRGPVWQRWCECAASHQTEWSWGWTCIRSAHSCIYPPPRRRNSALMVRESCGKLETMRVISAKKQHTSSLPVQRTLHNQTAARFLCRDLQSFI